MITLTITYSTQKIRPNSFIILPQPQCAYYISSSDFSLLDTQQSNIKSKEGIRKSPVPHQLMVERGDVHLTLTSSILLVPARLSLCTKCLPRTTYNTQQNIMRKEYHNETQQRGQIYKRSENEYTLC